MHGVTTKFTLVVHLKVDYNPKESVCVLSNSD